VSTLDRLLIMIGSFAATMAEGLQSFEPRSSATKIGAMACTALAIACAAAAPFRRR